VTFAQPAHYRRAGRALPTGSLSGGADGCQNHRGRALNAIQRRGERVAVAVIQVQVINRRLCDLKPDGFADNEGQGFRFEFARVT
jgi:hypothetical protein